MLRTQSNFRNRTLNLLMGITLSLGFVFISFEYSSRETVSQHFDHAIEIFDYVEQDIPITRRLDKQRALPKPPPMPINLLNFKIEELTLQDELDDYDIVDEAVEQTLVSEDVIFDDYPDEVPLDDSPKMFVEQMPRFPGGEKALLQFLQQNVKYPQLAAEYGVSGMVTVQFVVSKTGQVTQVTILKSQHDALDAEAVRVVKSMPQWIPGRQSGKNVAVYFRIPVHFTLR